jgi:predicted DNA-binding protein (MmcQ/YjbR family)
MNLDDVRTYCLKKKGKITEEFPFDEETLVFKVFGKMFLLTNVNEIPLSMNLKCDPERALEWRERYPSVTPGYHMNKKLWNTVNVDGMVPESIVYTMIDHSYEEVVKGLPKKIRSVVNAPVKKSRINL